MREFIITRWNGASLESNTVQAADISSALTYNQYGQYDTAIISVVEKPFDPTVPVQLI